MADLVEELSGLLVQSGEKSEDEGLHHRTERVLEWEIERLVDVEQR